MLSRSTPSTWISNVPKSSKHRPLRCLTLTPNDFLVPLDDVVGSGVSPDQSRIRPGTPDSKTLADISFLIGWIVPVHHTGSYAGAMERFGVPLDPAAPEASLTSQRSHRIERRCASCGDCIREQTDRRYPQHHQCVDEGISRADAEQQIVKITGCCERHGQTKCRA